MEHHIDKNKLKDNQMATLTNQGKFNLAVLKKIKEYPEYKNHLPIIEAGLDTFSGYIDYYLAFDTDKIADIVFIQTILPMPGYMGNRDYMVAMIDPNEISVTYDSSYYGFDSKDIEPAQTMEIDTGVFFRTILRTAEYGCLNWGIPFRRYTLRTGYALYMSGVKELICNEDDVFSFKGDAFLANEVRPVDNGTQSCSYDDIKLLYIPTVYLNAIGGQLGIYPDALLEYHSNILHDRKIFVIPRHWLSSDERRKGMMDPYLFGQVVHNGEEGKSYISLKDNNIFSLDDSEAWKEIDYRKPLDYSLLEQTIASPVEELLGLFNKTFDLSLLTP
jgi:hypothetical protein